MTSSIPFVSVQQKLAGRTWQTCGTIVAVDGTAYPGCPNPPQPIVNGSASGWFSGFSSGLVGGVINSLDGLWDSYCVGYGAATIPMWPTVQQAREIVVSYLESYAAAYKSMWGDYPPIVMTGYSQGSMAVDQVWVYDFLTPPGGTDTEGNPTGRLHYLLDYVYRSYQFGHVFRCPGIAWGNALIGLPQSIQDGGVETGGIGGPLDLTVAQTNYTAPDGGPVVYSCVNQGDIYSACEVGLDPWEDLAPEGDIADIFYKIVMQPTFLDVISAAKVLEHPLAGIVELFRVMQFFAEGTNAPHYEYFPQMVGCVNDCYKLGLSLPHQL